MPDDLRFRTNSGDNIEESVQNLRIQTDGKEDEPDSIAYPDRPGEPDCVYYLRTGMCGYGDDCKFNHPTHNVQDNDNQHGCNLPERVGEPDCAYFLKTGACKYGWTCKYNHPRDRRGAGPVVFSTASLPMREGEESCSHYLRTGSCKFGVTCKFHHPEPALDGPNPSVSGPLSHAPTSAPGRTSGAPACSYLSPQTYFPDILSSSGRTRGWSAYIVNMSAFPSTNGLNSVDHAYPSTPGFHLPVRPGEPECRYFKNTGSCKYGSDCKYHHPRKNMVKSGASSLSPFGLPLRPGQPVCSYYSLYGICKYGPGCKYDHPLMVYSYNYITGLTSLAMVDPTMFSYGEMNPSESSPSKTLKKPSRKTEQIGNVKLGTDDSSGDHVGSSRSSSQNQSD